MRKPALSQIVRAAGDYERNLLNRNFLLIGIRDDEVRTLELRFLSHHFKHLTGVRTVPPEMKPATFFDLCVSHRLSERDIDLDVTGHAAMKLDAARSMFTHDLSARSFGEANGARRYVQAEQYAGNGRACMGFEKHETRFGDPVTLLRSPIRDEVLPKDTYKVKAVMSKGVRDPEYQRLEKIDQAADWELICQSLPEGMAIALLRLCQSAAASIR